MSDETVKVDLTEEECALLVRGLEEWGGPARPTDAVARAMGFESVQARHERGDAETIHRLREVQRKLVGTARLPN